MLASINSCASHAALIPVLSLDSIEELAPGQGFKFVDENCAVEDSLAVLLSEEMRSQVTHFVHSLPPRLQSMARRHYWLEQSQLQIADDLGVTRSAVCHALAKINSLGRKFFGIVEH